MHFHMMDRPLCVVRRATRENSGNEYMFPFITNVTGGNFPHPGEYDIPVFATAPV
jgi:hypothetical protein